MATKRDPRVMMAPAYQAERRRVRRPQHKFSLKTLPYQAQPFMIAPVLPGETLQNLLLQARVVTDPLDAKMKLFGWWNEYFFYYVKHRDLMGTYGSGFRDAMTEMMITPNFDPVAAGITSAASVKYYHYDGGANYTLECLKRVLEEFFRDEGENWDVATIDGVPSVRIYGRGQNDAFDSLTLDGDYLGLGQPIPSGADATVEDLDYAYQQWLAMRDAGLMTMDYEDFIRQYGVQTRQDEDSPNLHRPELIRHVREFTYPTNIVEPTTGVPAVAATWSVADRADKRMFFSEPGWIFGLNVCRPKIYLSAQKGSVAHQMINVQNWLPASIHARSDVSHMFCDADEGPLQDMFTDGTNPQGYWLDLRDLLSYGDQYVNYAVAGRPGIVNLPKGGASATSADRRYASLLEVQAMFAAVEDPSVEKVINHDGVVSLGILGRQSAKPGQLVMGSGGIPTA